LSKTTIKKLIETILKEELENFSDSPEFLYHVTYFSRLERIATQGLLAGQGRSIGAPSYDSHAAKGLFLTEPEGIRFWFGKSENFAEHRSDNPYEDGLVPVVLRIDAASLSDDKMSEDDLGTRDAFNQAYIYKDGIAPDYLEIWDGSSWIPVEDYWDVDTLQAFTVEQDEDSGDDLYWFKNDNPLMPGTL